MSSQPFPAEHPADMPEAADNDVAYDRADAAIMHALLQEYAHAGVDDDDTFIDTVFTRIRAKDSIGRRHQLMAQAMGLVMLATLMGLVIGVLTIVPETRDIVPIACIVIGLIVFLAAPIWRRIESMTLSVFAKHDVHLSRDTWVYRTLGVASVILGNVLMRTL